MLSHTPTQQGLHRGPTATRGPKPPWEAAGSKGADSAGAEQKGSGEVPSAVPSPPWDSICCADLGS